MTKQELIEIDFILEAIRDLDTSTAEKMLMDLKYKALESQETMTPKELVKRLENGEEWVPAWDKQEQEPIVESNCYGDGNVYRGLRSRESSVKTYHVNHKPAPSQEQEPVGYFQVNDYGRWEESDYEGNGTPFYTHPAQPLSNETVRAEFRSYVDNNLDVDDGFRFVDFLEGVRYAEKAHGIV